MDPLSLTVSTITILGATKKTIQGLEKLRRAFGAHDKLLELLNEVADLRALFAVIHDTLASYGPGEAASIQVISTALERAQSLLDELNATIDKTLKLSDPAAAEPGPVEEKFTAPGGARISRRAWLLHENKLLRLQGDLKDVRVRLTLALSSSTASVIPKIRLQVQDLSISSTTLSTTITMDRQQLHDHMSHHTVILQDVQSLLEQLVSNRPQPATELSPSEPSNLLSSEGKQTTSLSSPSGNMILPSDLHASNTLRIRGSVSTPSKCPKGCSCQCHSASHIRSPPWLRGMLGLLLVGYSGTPAFGKRSCNKARCRSSRVNETQISYYFPSWLVQRMVNIILTHSTRSRPSMSIRVTRVLPDTAPLFNFARSGDTASIQSLFQKGLCSPIDVGEDGRSALHTAIYARRAETAKFLLLQGADVEYEDKHFISAVGACWEMSFQNLTVLEPCTIGKSRDEDDYLDEFTARVDYKVLHKIVLGIANIPLENYLKHSTEDINCQDSAGKTPLHWASVRGDFKMMQTLLNFGADPNFFSNSNWTPTHHASMSKHPECLEILLKHGARVNEPNVRADTAMSIHCLLHDDEVCLNILYTYGGDVDSFNKRGETLLHRASLRDHALSARWLIAHGVHLNATDATGCSALHQCVKNCSRKTLQVLLDAGCYTDTKANDGRTIVHDAAASADLETLSILVHSCVERIDIEAKDSKGMTALDVFEEYHPNNLDGHEASMFNKLLRQVGQHSSTPLSEKSAEEVQLFFDSLEEMESSVGSNSMTSSYHSLTNSHMLDFTHERD